jgi:hypothetical protein
MGFFLLSYSQSIALKEWLLHVELKWILIASNIQLKRVKRYPTSIKAKGRKHTSWTPSYCFILPHNNNNIHTFFFSLQFYTEVFLPADSPCSFPRNRIVYSMCRYNNIQVPLLIMQYFKSSVNGFPASRMVYISREILLAW